MLPSWVAHSPPLRPARRRSSGFLSKTLRDGARFASEALFAERIARQSGLLQSIDARVKLLTVLALVVTVAFTHHVPSVWVLGGFAVIALQASGVGARSLFSRAVWLLPSAFLLVAIPAALNVVTPGDTLVTLLRFDHGVAFGPIDLPGELTITRQGLASAAMLASRIAVGVLLATALALTTRWQEMLKAAHTSVTAVFVLVLAMTYRYVFVLLRVVEEMHLARKARTITPGTLASDRRWIGGRVGALFLRSRRLSERVYDAMLARGYTGRPRTLTSFQFGAREGLFVFACALAIAAAVLFDRLLLVRLRW